MSDQDGVGGTREPSGVVRMMVSDGAKEGGAKAEMMGFTGRGGVMEAEAGDGARICWTRQNWWPVEPMQILIVLCRRLRGVKGNQRRQC